MGRPGLTRHRKFLRLARELNRHYQGLGVLLARGVLESMWDAAYESGDPFVGGADDVEDAVRWPGPAGACCEALLSAGGEGRAGFIETVTGGGYIIHDLWDHAPDYVRKRHAREREREERGAALALTSQRPDRDRSISAISGQPGRKWPHSRSRSHSSGHGQPPRWLSACLDVCDPATHHRSRGLPCFGKVTHARDPALLLRCQPSVAKRARELERDGNIGGRHTGHPLLGAVGRFPAGSDAPFGLPRGTLSLSHQIAPPSGGRMEESAAAGPVRFPGGSARQRSRGAPRGNGFAQACIAVKAPRIQTQVPIALALIKRMVCLVR
jgi:hypothetical protein